MVPALGEPLSLDPEGFALEAVSAMFLFVTPGNLQHAVKLLKHLAALALTVKKVDAGRFASLCKVRALLGTVLDTCFGNQALVYTMSRDV